VTRRTEAGMGEGREGGGEEDRGEGRKGDTNLLEKED